MDYNWQGPRVEQSRVEREFYVIIESKRCSSTWQKLFEMQVKGLDIES